VIIRNVLGEEIDRVEGVRDLWGQDLRGRQWPHVDLSGMFLGSANLEGANLLGARLVNTSFSNANLRGAEVSFANADGANFYRANLDGCLMYRTQVRHARFDEAKITHQSDIPNWRTTYGGDKPIKRSKEDFARFPERPRCLLILGDPMGPFQRYEQSDCGTKPGRRRGIRRSRFEKRDASC
jgi:Pentapeptide repeats (8 copies)